MTLRNKNEHFACRQIFTASAKRHGFAPFYWDNGYPDNHQFGWFSRSTGAHYYPTTINLIVTAQAALGRAGLDIVAARAATACRTGVGESKRRLRHP